MTMDVATRAELDALRLRAYGPAADIAEDPAALIRLAALEDLALPATPSAGPDEVADTRDLVGRTTPDESMDAAPVDARVMAIIPAGAARGRRRPLWHAALVAAVALVTVPLGVTAAAQSGTDVAAAAAGAGVAGEIPAGVREAAAFVGHPLSKKLMEVRLDGYFGVDLDIDDREVPLFPIEGPMTWVEPLGEYYGWKLWIGGAEGAGETEACLLLDGDATMRADCVATSLQSQGALLLSVPYDGLAAGERPAQMTADQSLGFWWGSDGAVTILLGPTEVDPAGATSLLDTGGSGAQDALAPRVIPVLIDRITGDAVDLSTIADAPTVPASGRMTWAQPLGEHFGWQLWIGQVRGTRGDQFCILLNKDSVTRSRCAAREWRADGDLVVSLPYSQIDAEDRPFEMTPDRSIAFRWAESGYVTVQPAQAEAG